MMGPVLLTVFVVIIVLTGVRVFTRSEFYIGLGRWKLTGWPAKIVFVLGVAVAIGMIAYLFVLRHSFESIGSR